jgi:hypothetical protein
MVAGLWRIPLKKETMRRTLGGFMFMKSAKKYDYCYIQTAQSLSECCDKVAIIYFDDDCDIEDIQALGLGNITYHRMEAHSWDYLKGKTKISIFQNIAAMFLDTDYQLLVQADEVIHPDSYSAIREAIETGEEGFLCERINLWGTPNTKLIVPLERQPCSVWVNRLTKRGYLCYDDGENINSICTSDFVDRIKIIHYGFVRKREVMKAKIINMQERVFAMGHHDPKLDGSDVFDSTLWFKDSDLAPIDFEHPDFMKEWISQRL